MQNERFLVSFDCMHRNNFIQIGLGWHFLWKIVIRSEKASKRKLVFREKGGENAVANGKKRTRRKNQVRTRYFIAADGMPYEIVNNRNDKWMWVKMWIKENVANKCEWDFETRMLINVWPTCVKPFIMAVWNDTTKIRWKSPKQMKWSAQKWNYPCPMVVGNITIVLWSDNRPVRYHTKGVVKLFRILSFIMRIALMAHNTLH